MSRNKLIAILLFLLLLLIILCTWVHGDKIAKNRANTLVNNPIEVTNKSVNPPIHFNLSKEDESYRLKGEFRHAENVQKLQKEIDVENFTNSSQIKTTLKEENDVILLVEQLIPLFKTKYSEGSINYNGEKLTVEGTVNSSEDRDMMSTLLANSPIASTNNTKVHFIPTEAMKFKIGKEKSLITLQGEFVQESDSQTLIDAFETDNIKTDVKINNKLIPNAGVIHLTKQLAHLLKMSYLSGSITYDNQTIAVEGTTESQKVKDEMEALLLSSNIPYENHTEVVVLGPTKEELLAAKLAKEEAEKAQLQKEKAEAEKAQLNEKKVVEVEIKKILALENINFELNKAALTQKSNDTIKHIAKVLKEHPTLQIEIAGHTDSDGDAAYNLTLSQNRVNSVKAKLIEMEIEADRLKAIGYGETKPLVSNDTKENKRLNRRVEFIIIGE